MKKNLEIFIASSSKYAKKRGQLVDRRNFDGGKLKVIIDSLKQYSFKPIPWWDTDVYFEGETTLKSLISASRKYDGGVFVFGKDYYDKNTGKKIPNTNVMLEAGMFFSSKGIKRTFIVTDEGFNANDLPTDISGYQIADLNDENLAEKMKDFFKKPYISTNKKFDRTSYYIYKDYYGNIERIKCQDWKTKSLYIGDKSSDLWNDIEKSPEYHVNIKTLNGFQKKIIKEKKVIFEDIDNVISFGCGNGESDKRFLRQVVTRNSNICYIPIDINPKNIYYAFHAIENKDIPFSIVCDFEKDEKHVKNIITNKINEIGENNFFTMLGVTFSNLEGVETDFFDKVMIWMDKNDFFLLDASLKDDNDLDRMEELAQDAKYKALLHNSLIEKGLIDNSTKINDINIETDEIENSTEYTLIDSTKIYCYKYGDCPLLISKRYEYKHLKAEIERIFNLIDSEPVESTDHGKKAYFLFKLK